MLGFESPVTPIKVNNNVKNSQSMYQEILEEIQGNCKRAAEKGPGYFPGPVL